MKCGLILTSRSSLVSGAAGPHCAQWTDLPWILPTQSLPKSREAGASRWSLPKTQLPALPNLAPCKVHFGRPPRPTAIPVPAPRPTHKKSLVQTTTTRVAGINGGYVRMSCAPCSFIHLPIQCVRTYYVRESGDSTDNRVKLA
ncbi:hypothetical protein LZ31DRAFT_196464 [Colletotrichum somersetense]|nr:hypothetical protein LZ31DRAFT_196464 [Colletotrichum somersetense]